MSDISEKMRTCPLKQHIRMELWEKYIRKIKNNNISYLTLYCPTMMDIKYFTKVGLITHEDNTYKGVVGITNNSKDYAAAIASLNGRIELLLEGTANDVINSRDGKITKQILSKFPFDAINLDYCDYIFGSRDTEFLSSDLLDFISIMQKQNESNCKEFVLFLTTRSDVNATGGGFAKSFKSSLKRSISDNIEKYPVFKQKFISNFNTSELNAFERDNYDYFIAVGIIKLLLKELFTHGYTIKDCNANWLIRNDESPLRSLLHLAFHISRPKATVKKLVSDIGKSEYGGEIILDRIKAGHTNKYTVKSDFERLNSMYSVLIGSFGTFEIDTPKPI
jgi:hypothetical protein